MANGKVGAPKGNKNGAKNKPWEEAIRMELAHDRPALRRIAQALIKAASEGDVSAIKEFGDRIDGKVTQPGTLSGQVQITFSGADRDL